MLSIFKNIFSSSKSSEYIENDALLIDVRSKSEYLSGHIPSAKNIPLEHLVHEIEHLRAFPQLVVYCRSGNRSAHAKKVLLEHGFKNVVDGGSLTNIQSLVNAKSGNNDGLIREMNDSKKELGTNVKDPLKLKVLIPADFSEQTEFAYIITKKLEEHFTLEIHFLHVIDVPDGVTLSNEGVIETCGEIDSDFLNQKKVESELKLSTLKEKYGNHIFTHLLLGKITDTIIQYAEDNHFDLIALGTKGAWGIKDKISSSQAQIIARLSKVPILSVMCDRSDLDIRNILFVHDFKEKGEVSLPLLGRISKYFDVNFHLLHMIAEGSTEDTDLLLEYMKSYALENGIEKFESHFIIARDIEEGVNQWLETRDADMVCIGTHGKGSFFHSSPAEKIIKHLFKPIISFHLTQN